MARIQDLIQQGIRADQPLATDVSVGTLYGVTDEGDIIERSDGAAWQPYSPSVASAPSVVQLAQVLTSGSQATVDFTSISASYTSLKVLYFSRDTQAGAGSVAVRLKVNNDGTSGNYTVSYRIGSQNSSAFASTQAASALGVAVGNQPQDTVTAGVVGAGEVTLVGYAGTTYHKRILAFSGLEDTSNNGTLYNATARWISTAAITRLTFGTDGTAFKDGSLFTLYGYV